ncbi:MAG: type II secretion system F family protein [Labilithrix sp.]|nr:type II secretion system F family protein [Labilithrix sp.]
MNAPSALFFRWGAIALSAMSIWVVAYKMASTASRPNERLGRRGMKRMEALAKSEGWRTVEPLVRWLGVRLSKIMPGALSRHLERQILYSGDYLGLLPEEVVAICFLSLMLGAVLGSGVDLAAGTKGLATMGFATAGAIGPYMQLMTLAEERRHKIGRALPYAVDALTLSMSAGLDFPGALRNFVSRALPDDPLTEELELLLANLNLGHTRKAALIELAERTPTDAVKEFVHTVVQAEEKGTPLSEVLTIQATISRQRRTTRAEELAAKAGVKMSIPLGLLLATLVALLVAPLLLKARQSLGHSERDVPVETRTSRTV